MSKEQKNVLIAAIVGVVVGVILGAGLVVMLGGGGDYSVRGGIGDLRSLADE